MTIADDAMAISIIGVVDTDALHAGALSEDGESAEESGAAGTPTFFIGNRRHVGPYDVETLTRALQGSLSMSPRGERRQVFLRGD
jgi:protein-disulfide isomerase